MENKSEVPVRDNLTKHIRSRKRIQESDVDDLGGTDAGRPGCLLVVTVDLVVTVVGR